MYSVLYFVNTVLQEMFTQTLQPPFWTIILGTSGSLIKVNSLTEKYKDNAQPDPSPNPDPVRYFKIVLKSSDLIP